MAERQKTQRAIVDCGRWLAVCMRLGWTSDHLDVLQAIWWQHHDDQGNLTPGVAPCDDARDAARYRWLRNFGNFAVVDQMLDSTEFNTLDLAVDSAMGAAGVMVVDEALALARRFHEAYERLAPHFDYETRTETREFDPSSPNGRLMVAVCRDLFPAGVGVGAPAWTPEPPCWLVERRAEGCTTGYLGHANGSYEWMPTPDKATRFVRREDANGVAECIEPEDVIVAEHIWG